MLCVTGRILQWNIERGYKLAGIIDELRQIDADIICLQASDVSSLPPIRARCARCFYFVFLDGWPAKQEVDIGCDRSRGDDCGREIASSLGEGRRGQSQASAPASSPGGGTCLR